MLLFALTLCIVHGHLILGEFKVAKHGSVSSHYTPDCIFIADTTAKLEGNILKIKGLNDNNVIRCFREGQPIQIEQENDHATLKVIEGDICAWYRQTEQQPLRYHDCYHFRIIAEKKESLASKVSSHLMPYRRHGKLIAAVMFTFFVVAFVFVLVKTLDFRDPTFEQMCNNPLYHEIYKIQYRLNNSNTMPLFDMKLEVPKNCSDDAPFNYSAHDEQARSCLERWFGMDPSEWILTKVDPQRYILPNGSATPRCSIPNE